MKKEKKQKKNKKILAIIICIGTLITMLGGVLAYFTTSFDFTNIFQTALYQHSIVETFESPTTWTPGTTTNKTIKITNDGNIDMALRASFTEKWTSANGEELPLCDSENNIVAIINFNDSWKKDSDGYFYYGTKENKSKLMPNETSSSFIESVTFNENVKATLNFSTSNDKKIITVTSTGNGYDNATYTLIIKIDTIQYDLANEIWK